MLAAAFFVLVGLYEPGSGGLLTAALVLYILAGATDILDGYLARKLNLTSAFGRIVDPLVDKVLVVGAFAMLAGSNFFGGLSEIELALPAWVTGRASSSVQPWMVVAIMAREFVVSGVRGYSESRGVKFPATYAGKLKMFIQSFAICMALHQVANLPTAAWAIYLKIGAVWAAVLVTVLSALIYSGKARRLLVFDEQAP